MKAALIGIILVGACAGRQRAPEFMDEVRGYGEGLRWRRPVEAAMRVPTREREDFLSEREELDDDLRIADWEVERVDWLAPGQRAKVRVTYTWMLDSRGLVFTTVADQRWELRGKAWLMVAEERRRGEPMPGLAEPSSPKSPEAAVNEPETPAIAP